MALSVQVLSRANERSTASNTITRYGDGPLNRGRSILADNSFRLVSSTMVTATMSPKQEQMESFGVNCVTTLTKVNQPTTFESM